MVERLDDGLNFAAGGRIRSSKVAWRGTSKRCFSARRGFRSRRRHNGADSCVGRGHSRADAISRTPE